MKLIKNLVSPGLAGLSLLALLLTGGTTDAATLIKADNTNALGSAASWVGGAAPGPNDVARWEGAYSASPNNAGLLTNSLRAVNSGSAISWQGISVGTLTGTALTTNTIYWGTSGNGAETNLSAATQSGNLVTITTKANHGFAPGQQVTIAGVTPAGYNGTFTVVGVPSVTTFTCSNAVSGLTPGTAFGTVESAIYIGGAGATVINSSYTLGTAGIDMSGASHSVALVATGFAFVGNQTWNLAPGKNLRLAAGGVQAANAKVVTSGSDGLIDISGGGIVDANQGGASGVADAAGFTGFTGKWRVNAGATLRGLRNGATAWGSNPAADSITLNGGTLAVGGISGAVGNWTWTNQITLAPGTTSYIDEQNVAGTGRYLKLNGPIHGNGNLVFRDTGPAGAFTSPDLGFILTGNNDLSGTVTIGGPNENGIAGRLSYVRVGGVGGDNLTTGIGADGSLGTAAIVNNGVLTFSLNTSLTVGPVSGTGSLRVGYTAVAGAEQQNVTLTGANTYTGNTTINAGTLSLAPGATLANSTNIFLTPFTAASAISAVLDASLTSGFTLGNGRTIQGGQPNAAGDNIAAVYGVVTAAGGSAIVPGGSNYVNSLTFGSDLNLSGGGVLVYNLSSTSGDLINVSGNLNPSGVTTVAVTAPGGILAEGTYPLINVSGTLGGTPANFAVTGLTSTGRGQTFGIIYEAPYVKLRVVGSPATLAWRGDGVANLWNIGLATNWDNAGLADVYLDGDAVSFDDLGSDTPAINLTTNVKPSSLSINASKNYVLGGTGGIVGSVTLSKNGTGSFTLGTSNTYTGPTLIAGGTLAVNGGNAIVDTGLVGIDSGATFQVLASETVNTVTNVAGATVAAQAGTLTYTNGSLRGNLTDSGRILRLGVADTADQFQTADALAFNGTISLRGSTPSTSPGAMQAATGRFWLNSVDGSQLAGTKFHFDTGAGPTNAQDVIIGDWDATSGNRKLTLASLSGYGSLRSDAGSGGQRNIIVDQAVDTTYYGMILSHYSTHATPILRSVRLEKLGAGTLTLANVVGTQTAAAGGVAPLEVAVTGGKLVLTATNTFAGALTVGGGATVELAGAGLLGAGNYTYSITNAGTLVFSGSGNQTLAGVISGTGGLIKTGSGRLTLSGVNTYSGPTTVAAGALVGLTGGSAGTGTVTIDAGATNRIQVIAAGQFSCAGLSFGSGTTYAEFNLGSAPSTSLAPLQVNGNLSLGGTLVVSASGNLAPGTYPLIKYTGTFSGTLPATVTGPGLDATLVHNPGSQTIEMQVNSAAGLSWAVGDGLWDINTSTNWLLGAAASVYYDGIPTLLSDSAAGTSPITITLDSVVAPGFLRVVANKDYTIVGNGGIGGSAGLSKGGAGTLQLSTVNTFTGPISITNGTLALVGSGSLGAGTYTAPILNNGALSLARTSGNQALLGSISGTGSLSQNGTAPLYMGGGHSYSGPTTIQSGYLEVREGGLRLTNSVLNLTSADARAVDIWGGRLQVRGLTGTGQLASNGSFDNGASWWWTLSVDRVGLTLDVPAAEAYTFDGVVKNGSWNTPAVTTIEKTGSGTQWLNGSNTYTGETFVRAGTLGLTTAHRGGGNVTVADGAKLRVANNGNGLSAAIGTLTVGTAGTAVLEFAGLASTNVPLIATTAGVVLNGTPQIVIADGAGLAAGGVYPLFGYAGALSGTLPTPVLPTGVVATLMDDTANGWVALSVTSVAVEPPTMTASVIGSSLQVQWPTVGWQMQVQTNALTTGLTTNWSNWPGSTTTNRVFVPIDPANPAVFLRLLLP